MKYDHTFTADEIKADGESKGVFTLSHTVLGLTEDDICEGWYRTFLYHP